MPDELRPIKVNLGPQRHRAETDAMVRARRYAALDPFYEGKPVTRREDALMQLALRALTEPILTEGQIALFETHGAALNLSGLSGTMNV